MSELSRKQVEAFDAQARAAIGKAPDEESRHFAVRAMEFAHEAAGTVTWLEFHRSIARNPVEQIEGAVGYLRTWRGFEMMWDAMPSKERWRFRDELAAVLRGDMDPAGLVPAPASSKEREESTGG